MSEEPLIVAMVFVPAFAGMVAVTRIVSDNRTRRKLVEAHASEQVIHALYMRRTRDPDVFASLKWGLVSVGIGLALLVIQMLPYEFDEPIAYGLMFSFAGAGLLAFYAIAAGAARRSAPDAHTRPVEVGQARDTVE